MVVSHNQAHRMWDHESDEADRTGRRDCSGGEERGKGEQQPRQAHDVDAQRCGDGVAARERVQIARKRKSRRDGER